MVVTNLQMVFAKAIYKCFILYRACNICLRICNKDYLLCYICTQIASILMVFHIRQVFILYFDHIVGQ